MRPLVVRFCACLCLCWLLSCCPAFAQSAPTAPTSLSGYAVCDTYYGETIELQWNSAASNAGPVQYSVERSAAAGTWQALGASAVGPPFDTGTIVIYEDAGLTPSTAYSYRVRAYRLTGGAAQYSAYSNVISVTTLVAPPPAPASVSATAGDGTATVTWGGSAGATSYLVLEEDPTDDLGDDTGLSYHYVPAPAGGGAAEVTFTGLADGTTYAFWVAAVIDPSGQGEGVASPSTGPATATPEAVLTAPANLVATSGDDYVTLAWNAVTGATGYRVYRSTTPGGEGNTSILGIGTNSVTDQTITSGQAYFYQVTSLNGTTESGKSHEASATPQEDTSPLVNLTAPVAGTVATPGTSLVLAADAAAATGRTISKVDFLQNGTLIGTATASPYTITWAAVPAGNYSLTAVGTDSAGQKSTSDPVAITIQSQVTGSPHLTEAQAIQAARTFCQAIGAPVGASDTVVAIYPAPNDVPTQPASYWQPRWKVVLGDDATVEVVDATQVISSYFNNALSSTLNTASGSAGAPLPQSTVVADATAVVQASGQPMAELSSPLADNEQITDSGSADGALWTVTWQRQLGGTPYHNQQAIVMMQASSGAVESYSLAFPSAPPAQPASAISSNQAQQIAAAQLESLGVSGEVFQTATEEVVTPNGAWQPQAPTLPTLGLSRVAWACFFAVGPATDEVWVDVETSNVIGGDTQMLLRSHIATKTKTRTHPRKVKRHIEATQHAGKAKQ